MKYDIHFSIAALFVYLLLLFSIRVQYNNGQNSVRKLKHVIICLFLADLFDIISAYTIAYHDYVPVAINYLTNGAFFLLETLCMALFPRYIRYVIDPENGKKTLFDWINEIIVAVFAIICATSFYTHFIYYFEGTKYKKGSLYNLTFILGWYFLTYSFIRLWVYRKSFSKRQFYSIIGFIIIAIGGSIIQFIMPGSLFVLYFGFSLAAFITIFGLETPDYIKLEKALNELEDYQKDLKDALERAEKADLAKSEFLANMSHEIRTPINAVLGMNELISRESNEEAVKNYSSNIADAGRTLLSLINDILDFSKIEAGKMELAPYEYELSTLLREVNNIIAIRCENKGLIFEIKNDKEIPNKLYGDEVRIRQILINLLNNALKYTDKGTVQLFADYEKSKDDAIELIFTVKDSGIGIKEEDLQSLFESFKRIDLENNRKREGTGLGLSITKSLVELMDGSIDVKSVYGEGSEFSVRITQRVIDNTSIGDFSLIKDIKPKKEYKESFTAKDAKILVVDDVKMNLNVIAGLLKKTGVQVDLALSGKECLDKIKETTYDIIFLDHMMPEMDGLEVREKMIADLSHMNQTTPVVMLTANAILGAKEEYINSGFSDYLSKPVFPKDLENMLIKYIPDEKLKLI